MVALGLGLEFGLGLGLGLELGLGFFVARPPKVRDRIEISLFILNSCTFKYVISFKLRCVVQLAQMKVAIE